MIHYVYFVSYWFQKGEDHWGVGNAEVTINAKIMRRDQWKEIEKTLAEPGMKVFINNFQFLHTEEVEESP